MYVNIFGASGSGVTTLGNVISQKLGCPYFDSDHYFWLPAQVPFTERRPPQERNALINLEMAGFDSWILGGSVINWHNSWQFDLSVFLYIPQELRLNRLKQREYERYGDIIHTDKERNRLYKEFISWAKNYDGLITTSRSLHAHKNWMNDLKTPLLVIEGDTSVEERLKLVLDMIEKLKR